MDFTQITQLAENLKRNIASVVVGKADAVDLLLIALISSGHVLLEEVPGTGKTLLAKTMAKSLNCTFKRIQFTPDLLPSDLSGINFFNQKQNEFEFRPGPLFSHIVLADEINRATPRTQSSLLECMEERQVSIDGKTKSLERPFIVLATQNPVDNQGTFPLPEAQLDRFLLKIKLGYPTNEEGVSILKRFKEQDPLNNVKAVAGREEVNESQEIYSQVTVNEDLLAYIVEIAEQTRNHHEVALGVSPRGTQALLKAVQVFAILKGRDYVLPDDVKTLVKPVLAHRILLKNRMRSADDQIEAVLDDVLSHTPVPTEEKIG
ncbi:MAG TPA: MoxR family ATPase [Bacillales bacterium]|nr:MoxR family ATPase [Bacillales bacterium]